MGKPTRNELLAEYYLRAAGVAAVWIDAEGHVGAQDEASIDNAPGRIVYCCERGCHFILAYRLYEWKKGVIADPPAIAPKLEELADRGGVGLTPHAVAIDRALAAVAAVNDTIDKMGSTGELKAFNPAFKESRKVDPATEISTISTPGKRRCLRPWQGRRNDKAKLGGFRHLSGLALFVPSAFFNLRVEQCDRHGALTFGQIATLAVGFYECANVAQPFEAETFNCRLALVASGYPCWQACRGPAL
jgi:hypothetical protein